MTRINQDIVKRQIDHMSNSDLDAMIAVSPQNFTWVAGAPVPSQETLPWRHAAVITTADGRSAILCVGMEETTVRSLWSEEDVYVWQEFDENAMEVLADMVTDCGVATGRVGFEGDYLPASDFLRLQELLPDATLVPAQDGFASLRMIKTAREVDLLRDISQKTDRAISKAFQEVRHGDSEHDLAGAVISAINREGVDKHRILIVASGERSQYPNVGPTGRQLRDGDVIRLEIFGVINGYHAGVCRTAVVGDPGAEPNRVWKVLQECHDLVLADLEPGAVASGVYDKYVDHFSQLGYDPINFVGHGIGVHLHEPPYLGTHGDYVLEEGMVLGIEPLLYLPGEFGMQIKEIVAVQANGHELLSNVMDGRELYQVSE